MKVLLNNNELSDYEMDFTENNGMTQDRYEYLYKNYMRRVGH